MSILVGIDGTSADLSPGRSRDKRYDLTFVNSFVRRICTGFPLNKRYIRGPVALGGGLMNGIVEGQNFILSKRRATVNEPILLTGYSRGAAGVVVIATRLQRQNIDVRAMLLFDCVDRHADIDAELIPSNVGNVLHVMRAPESGSRGSFGNSATQHHPSTRYREAIFYCTHGGMGGVPWTVPVVQSPGQLTLGGRIPPRQGPAIGRRNDFIVESFPDGKTNVTYAQDAVGSSRVWGYVGSFIGEHGFQ